MSKDVNTQKFEAPSSQGPAKGAADQMFQEVHDLQYACPDGSLVRTPTDCGDLTKMPTDIDLVFGKLELV